MTVLERLKEFIESTGKSKSEIARLLDVTPQYIWKLFNNDSEPSERIILATLKTFPKLSEKWLRFGIGEMYEPKNKFDQVSQIASNVFQDDDSSYRYQLIKAFSMMTDEEIEAFKNSIDYIKDFLDKMEIKEEP